MSIEAIPPFQKMVESFRGFLAKEGHSTDIAWVFREDVIERLPRTYIRTPLPDNAALAERLCHQEIERGAGINLVVYHFLSGRPLCYVRTLRSRKWTMTIPTDHRIVIPVRSRAVWAALQACDWVCPRSIQANEIPKRAERAA